MVLKECTDSNDEFEKRVMIFTCHYFDRIISKHWNESMYVEASMSSLRICRRPVHEMEPAETVRDVVSRTRDEQIECLFFVRRKEFTMEEFRLTVSFFTGVDAN